MENNNSLRTFNQLLGKMRTSATIWTIIGLIQLVCGLFTIIFGYGLATIIIGIWNLVQSGRVRKAAKRFSEDPRGIVAYIDAQSSGILALIINLVLGAIIGIVGSIYDISTHNFALANRSELMEIDR